jgi:predicted ArsR family transcriptional regulator
MSVAAEARAGWVFLTNHAHVLLQVARRPDATLRQVAERVGITERAAHRIMADLVADGYVTRTRVGRRNHYRIHAKRSLRHPETAGTEVGALLDLLSSGSDRRRP